MIGLSKSFRYIGEGKKKKKSTFLRESEIVIHLEMLTQKQEETSGNILEDDRRTFHK